VLPAFSKPVNLKSVPVTVAGFTHTSPLMMSLLLKSATQKSSIGSASAANT
jgi:hypothetical protein